MSTIIEVFPEGQALIEAAATRLAQSIRNAVAARDRALVVLTGGGNGIGLLKSLVGRRDRLAQGAPVLG